MECKVIQKQLIFWIDGETGNKDSSIIEKHLSECTNCRNYAQNLNESLNIWENDRITENDPYMFARIQAKISSIKEVSVFEFFVKKIAVAAIIILAVASGIFIGYTINKNSVIYSDYKAEKYFLKEIQTDNLESYLLSDINE